jgi:hypothetical protein
MAPKGGNAKKEGGRAKKAENEVCPSLISFALLSYNPTRSGLSFYHVPLFLCSVIKNESST